MERIRGLARRAAQSNINVLILGETGVGKEVLAQTIHQMSPRAGGPIVCVNCAALPESLIESELFGHVKGAFTGAVVDRVGMLEAAHGGTLFFDELGELPAAVQARLLRVLETRQVVPVGATRARAIDVRFLAATNRDLEQDVLLGRFRRDLFFRLNGLSLTVPPLRERKEEIQGLARSFLEEAARAVGRPAPALGADAMALLLDYGWPGNIRELKNIVERALVLCDGDTITREHLPVEKMAPAGPFVLAEVGAPSPHDPAALDRRAEERRRILEALEACAGNQSRAARLLGIPRRTFVTKLDAYGIPRPRKGQEPAEGI
jgi:transcriptional regulator with PAS, ATPase and Fis domain